MTPVLRGLVKYESLLDGTLSLEDIARCNDAIYISDINEKRMHDVQNRGDKI